MSNAPFVTDKVRTAITLAYRNEDYVADAVLPRVPVSAEEFKWTEYNKQDRFTVPPMVIDRKGSFNQVEFGGTEQSSMTVDYGLEDVIPIRDIENGKTSKFDPRGHAVELITDLLMLGREQRVAAKVFDPANHDNTEALGGTDQWDDATSKPLVQLADAMEVPFMRPNMLVINPRAALALRRSPSVVKAYNGTTGDEGLVPMDWIRQTLGLQSIIVAAAKQNTQNPGQAAAYGHVWGDNALLFYRNSSAMPNKGLTYGLTAEYGTRISQTKRNDDIGLRGSVVQRVGESLKELVLSKDCAYLITDVLN